MTISRKRSGITVHRGERLLDTLEGVLNLSKLEAGQMDLELQPVDLSEEAKTVAMELHPKAEDKEITLHIETDDTSIWAKADAGRTQIVARNLLSNAIKYTDPDGTVWIRTYQNEEQAILEVEDTGIGMEPEIVEDLFKPFRQASEGLRREYEGTGVGLAVTTKAIEQMGGDLAVDTKLDEGSRFTVRLPKASPDEESEQKQLKRESPMEEVG